MPKAIQFTYKGHPLAGGAVFMTDGTHLGGEVWRVESVLYEAVNEAVSDEERASAEVALNDAIARRDILNAAGEAETIKRIRQDLADAYGLPPDDFDVVTVTYNGSSEYCAAHDLEYVAPPDESTPDAVPIDSAYLKRIAAIAAPGEV